MRGESSFQSLGSSLPMAIVMRQNMQNKIKVSIVCDKGSYNCVHTNNLFLEVKVLRF